MKLYRHLAWDGIRKNSRLYVPYLLTGVGAVSFFYILAALARLPEGTLPGSGSVQVILNLGSFVLWVFSLLLLFYTHSFLIRRRNREFALYNVLGMGKGDISRILCWESLLSGGLSLLGGLALGVVLSKLAELGLLRMVGAATDMVYRVSAGGLLLTLGLYAGIFLLILISSLVRVSRSTAVQLMRSQAEGEKPPRANWALAVLGILLLAGAYYLAVTIREPLAALTWFFIAVLMVILATYLLFISGSVALCRLLQKNPRFYYQKRHFVSVSSLVYRMKRNGAGLASICILCTMVLVIMMGAGSLYVGQEESLNTRYPHEFAASVDFLTEGETKRYSEEKADYFYAQVDEVLNSYDVTPENAEQVLSTTATGMLKDRALILDPSTVDAANTETMEYVTQVYLIPLSAYNQCMGTDKTLNSGEVFLHCVRRTYDAPVITLSDGTVLTVKEHLTDMMGSGEAAMQIIPSMFIVTDDIEAVMESFNKELGSMSGEYKCRLEVSYSFDADLSEEQQMELGEAIRERVRELDYTGDGGFYSYNVECKAEERADFYGLFGGIFFLGIFLSILFLAATVLIIYYKQVTEGYEDEARFEIMRKVGMTAKDIRKSINSQMLTVFFLPLVTAAVHTAFAFPIVQKLLAIFNLRNTALSLMVTGVAIVIFGIFYGVIYKITSNAYYSIVCGNKND